VASARADYLLSHRCPWLTFDSIDFLDHTVGAGWKVLEYGSGGSTLYWGVRGCTCVSVEHDSAWFATLDRKVASSTMLDRRLVPPGPPGSAPVTADPADPEHYVSFGSEFLGRSFESYARQADAFPDGYFDLVLVDGRARPSCIKHAVPKVRLGGWMVLDNSDRDYYFTKTGSWLSGFVATHFPGLGPINPDPWRTTVMQRVR